MVVLHGKAGATSPSATKGLAPGLFSADAVGDTQGSNSSSEHYRLLRVCGRRRAVQLQEVPATRESLTGAGAYILLDLSAANDGHLGSSSTGAGSTSRTVVYTWTGPQTPLWEKRQAVQCAELLGQAHHLSNAGDNNSSSNTNWGNVIAIEQSAPYVNYAEQPNFWALLEGESVDLDGSIERDQQDHDEAQALLAISGTDSTGAASSSADGSDSASSTGGVSEVLIRAGAQAARAVYGASPADLRGAWDDGHEGFDEEEDDEDEVHDNDDDDELSPVSRLPEVPGSAAEPMLWALRPTPASIQQSEAIAKRLGAAKGKKSFGKAAARKAEEEAAAAAADALV